MAGSFANMYIIFSLLLERRECLDWWLFITLPPNAITERRRLKEPSICRQVVYCAFNRPPRVIQAFVNIQLRGRKLYAGACCFVLPRFLLTILRKFNSRSQDEIGDWWMTTNWGAGGMNIFKGASRAIKFWKIQYTLPHITIEYFQERRRRYNFMLHGSIAAVHIRFNNMSLRVGFRVIYSHCGRVSPPGKIPLRPLHYKLSDAFVSRTKVATGRRNHVTFGKLSLVSFSTKFVSWFWHVENLISKDPQSLYFLKTR